MVDFHAFATNENTLLVSKIATVASIGIYAGTSLSFNTIIMPALRKFSSSSSVAIWNETVNAARGKCTDASFISREGRQIKAALV
jgi:hypothetical protein